MGPFRLTHELGRGASAVVWKALDDRLGRPVALKRLHGTPCTVSRERLRREARLLAAVNHPNVATLHDLLETDDEAWLVMELVEGATLSSLLHDGPMPRDRALGIVKQIAQGLDAAHEQGVLHFDLKPSNLKVTRTGLVKILDFGLAQRRQDGEPDLMSGIGTPGYMAPEQIRRERADRRADLFSLGCILFECLTGQPAFGRGPAHRRLEATRDEAPDWALLHRTAGTAETGLLRELLEKDCSARTVSARDVVSDLDELLASSVRSVRAVRAPDCRAAS